MANRDLELLNNIKAYAKEQIPIYLQSTGGEKNDGKRKIDHPLDRDVLMLLEKFQLRDEDDDYRIFYYLETIKEVWTLIIEKSIKCLRYFDKREPFLGNSNKRPIA